MSASTTESGAERVPAGDVPKLVEERDEARQIVRDIYWMALRYADGRQTYAPGMCNDAIRKAYDGGWLVHRHQSDPAFASDGSSPEYRGLEAENARLSRDLADARAALGVCQSALAMMIAPDAIKQTTVIHAFAAATEAEARARSVLWPQPKETPDG